jgi:hypothetical protein
MPGERESEIGTLKAIGPKAHPPESKYERLIARAQQVPPAQTIVVHPCDESSLRGPEAAELGIIKPILVGPAAKINHHNGLSLFIRRTSSRSSRLIFGRPG